MGEELLAGTYKYELEPHEGRLKPSDLVAVGVQQKPGPLVMELNTYI